MTIRELLTQIADDQKVRIILADDAAIIGTAKGIWDNWGKTIDDYYVSVISGGNDEIIIEGAKI
jgi:hypothetical protein